MKKIITILCIAVMALSLFAGCGQKADDNNTAAAGGTVSTDGSTSMEKVIGALGESFMEANSGTTFTYNPTGSGSGIQAVSEYSFIFSVLKYAYIFSLCFSDKYYLLLFLCHITAFL